MPLVQHNELPSFERVRLEGVETLTPAEINTQLPSLRVGFLNMMPDQAIAATERQFLRLVSAHDRVNTFFYPFTIAGIERSEQALEHVNQYYVDVPTLQSMQVDALVITGANVTQPLLINEPFWPALEMILRWAVKNVRSTICSCLATHAAAKVFYGIDRRHLGSKCWGVFEHEVVAPKHALVQGVESKFLMCHSRFNDVSGEALKANNVDVLISSEQVGMQMAIDEERGMLYFQGHPEYDDISLLKEYKREIIRYATGQREDYPPTPTGYFSSSAMSVAQDYKQQLLAASDRSEALIGFPEAELQNEVHNQWRQISQLLFKNWIHTLTH